MENITILGIMIKDRIKEANKTQLTLSKHAHIIKSRLGFHEVSENTCSRVGFILLQLGGKEWDRQQLLNELNGIGGVEIKDMSFDY